MEEKDKDGNQTIMKIRGVCVDILCEIDLSGLYGNQRLPESTICTHHISCICNACLSYALLLLQADQCTAQLLL